MLVEMLVEGVFLVSGVVKTVFCRFKKKAREFFCFLPRTKGGKAGLCGTFQIASFPYGNAENMFYNFVVLFFSSVNIRRVRILCVSTRTCSVFFSFRKHTAGKNSMRVIELVLHFFYCRRKFYACFGGNTTSLFLLFF
jgi:hypothetical protein